MIGACGRDGGDWIYGYSRIEKQKTLPLYQSVSCSCGLSGRLRGLLFFELKLGKSRKHVVIDSDLAILHWTDPGPSIPLVEHTVPSKSFDRLVFDNLQ